MGPIDKPTLVSTPTRNQPVTTTVPFSNQPLYPFGRKTDVFLPSVADRTAVNDLNTKMERPRLRIKDINNNNVAAGGPKFNFDIKRKIPEPVTDTSGRKGLSIERTADIINGVQAVGSGLLAYASSRSASNLKPSLLSAPTLTAKHVTDTGAQQAAAGEQRIASSIEGARESALRQGRTGLDGVFLSKEIEAGNTLAGQIEGMRTNIEGMNVAADNRVAEINATNKMNIDNINANAINSMNQFKTQMKSQALQTGLVNANANVNGIMQNAYAQKMMKLDQNRYDQSQDMELDIAIAKNANNMETMTYLQSIRAARNSAKK